MHAYLFQLSAIRFVETYQILHPFIVIGCKIISHDLIGSKIAVRQTQRRPRDPEGRPEQRRLVHRPAPAPE